LISGKQILLLINWISIYYYFIVFSFLLLFHRVFIFKVLYSYIHNHTCAGAKFWGGGTGNNQNCCLENLVFFRLKTVFSEIFLRKCLKTSKKSYFIRKIPRNTCFSKNYTLLTTPSTFFSPLEGGLRDPTQTLPTPMYVYILQ